MSDNDYNSNHEKDPWEKSEDDSADVKKEVPSEPVNETPEQPEQLEQTWQEVSSGKAEEPTEEQPVSAEEPTAEQNNSYQYPNQGQAQNSDTQNPQNTQNTQNPQAPYSPYGQYNNSYGQYTNPTNQTNPYGGYNNNSYGSNSYGNNGYGSYGQNQYNQNQYQPNQYNNQQQGQYWTYQQYGGQYQQQNPQQPKPPKRKNTGLRVFLWILSILVAGSVLGFCIFGVYTAIDQKNVGPETTVSQPDNNNGNNGGNNNDSGSASKPSSGQAPIGGVTGDGTNPNSTGIVINQIPNGSELSAKDVYKNVAESVVGVETDITDAATGQNGVSQGTGIIATSDGYILTNAHVVNYSRGNKVKVVLHNAKEYTATVVGYDQTSDIAVLKINATNLTPATFGDASQLEVGDQVIAIGNPGGLSYASSLTGGFVSALDRSIETHSDNGMTYIQTDAAINPGNSGGPLVNMYGQVVGINSNKIVATGFEGMGFAIPVSKAKTIIDDLIMHGYVSGRSRLGITASTITAAQAQLTGLPAGVMIREISAESDLKASNVVVGDIITKADGQEITSLDDLYAVLNKHKAGDTITLTIFSQGNNAGNGSTRSVKTKLLEDKGETQAR